MEDLLVRVPAGAKRTGEARGHWWVVDADIRSYFDSIPRERLLARVAEKIADGRVLALLGAYLEQEVMEGLERWTPEAVTPQGAVISPLLSNIYLDPLDHQMAERGCAMVRYADDPVGHPEHRLESLCHQEKLNDRLESLGL